jgi:hypothetical protein
MSIHASRFLQRWLIPEQWPLYVGMPPQLTITSIIVQRQWVAFNWLTKARCMPSAEGGKQTIQFAMLLPTRASIDEDNDGELLTPVSTAPEKLMRSWPSSDFMKATHCLATRKV